MRDAWIRLRSAFWLIPAVCVVAAVGLGIALTAVDRALDTSREIPFLFAGGPEGARSLLSAVITSMISFTGLVFSITIVVLQLASTQFSPRVLRTFLQDRFNQIVLGVFVATFVYALIVLREVRGTAQVDPFVPQLATTVAFGFVLVSVGVFLAYIHHIAQSIRVVTIIGRVGDETRALIERLHPADAEPTSSVAPPPVEGAATSTVGSEEAGVIQRVDDGCLAAIAERGTGTVVLLRAVGEFVPFGAPVMEIRGVGDASEAALCGALAFGRERTLDEDVGFGLRQLVDIAERALSPGTNDPSTAIQAIDEIHDLLRRLVSRPLGARQRVADDGRLLVDVPTSDANAYLELGIDEIAAWGADVERIRLRLDAMLADLLAAARPEHRAAVERTIARHGTGGWGHEERLAPSDLGLR